MNITPIKHLKKMTRRQLSELVQRAELRARNAELLYRLELDRRAAAATEAATFCRKMASAA